MIEYIDIQDFGSFQNFVWRDSIRDGGNNIEKFKKLNIIYGRNYSGKTTLSRIFRSLETGKLPDKFENPAFTVGTDSGTITQTQIPANSKFVLRKVKGNDCDQFECLLQSISLIHSLNDKVPQLRQRIFR
jgi:wobble nucleotide-excising tRNase